MIESVIVFLMLALAAFRLSELITVDDGPFDVFLKMRVILGAYDYGANGEPLTSKGKFISCPYCVGMWVCLVLTVIANWHDSSLNLIIYWLALSGAQALLQTIGGRK